MTPTPLDVVIDGRRIETVEFAGDHRTPIVLLHEGLGSVGLWRDFPAALNRSTGRRVIAYSRWGHGHSDPPPRRRTPAFFHEEALEVLPAFLEQVGAASPFLIGHSDGASIAMVHAAGHPVAGLTLMAPHVFVEQITVAAIEHTRRQYVDGGLRDRLARHHDDVDAAFWGWCDVWLDPVFATWTLQPEIAQLHATTLLVQSIDDPYGTLAQLDRIETAPATVSRLHVTGGHSPHLDARRETLTAIVHQLERFP